MSDSHLNTGDCIDYLESKLSPEREEEVERHLALCDSCVEQTRETHVLNQLCDWTAEQHGESLAVDTWYAALERAEAEVTRSSLRDRLADWRERGAGLSQGALRVVNSAVENAYRVVTHSIDAIVCPQSEWQFQAAAPTAGVRGTASTADDVAVVETDRGVSGPSARVLVRAGEKGQVVVRVDGIAPDQPGPLVVLVLSGDDSTVVVRETQKQLGTTYWVARFENLHAGEYLVAVEPLT